MQLAPNGPILSLNVSRDSPLDLDCEADQSARVTGKPLRFAAGTSAGDLDANLCIQGSCGCSALRNYKSLFDSQTGDFLIVHRLSVAVNTQHLLCGVEKREALLRIT